MNVHGRAAWWFETTGVRTGFALGDILLGSLIPNMLDRLSIETSAASSRESFTPRHVFTSA
jgi:hypothetical protein